MNPITCCLNHDPQQELTARTNFNLTARRLDHNPQQELTARTHYTGITRKRLIPVRVRVPEEPSPEVSNSHLDVEAGIRIAGGGRVVGRIRTVVCGDESEGAVLHALALFRLAPLAAGERFEAQLTSHEGGAEEVISTASDVEVCLPGWMDLAALAPEDGR